MRIYYKEWLAFAASAIVLVGGICWLSAAPKRLMPELNLTAGDERGLRHRLALEFAREVASHGLKINVRPVSGSEAAIRAVDQGEIDLAFVQGGLSGDRLTAIREVTPMHIEPLHLLVRSSLHEQVTTFGLSRLEDKSVNLGPVGSGTYALAEEVLNFAGLRASANSSTGSNENQPAVDRSGDYQASSLTYSELQSLPPDRLPDAIFTVSSLPSPFVEAMVESRDYRLVGLPFGEALSLESLLQLGESLPFGTVDKRHLFDAHIPAFTYSVSRSEPPDLLRTVGTRLKLVANERIPDEVVAILLDSLYSSNFAHAERPPLDASLLDLPSQYPRHPGAIRYRQRNKPLIAGDAIDYWEKVLAIAATLTGGVFFLGQWYLRIQRRRRETSFAEYMNRVLVIEASALKNELSAQLDLAQLIHLQRELAQLKEEVVVKFASGQLEGEGLVSSFLALVNDARSQLTRLILHQRDNVEDQAAKQQDSVQELWPSE